MNEILKITVDWLKRLLNFNEISDKWKTLEFQNIRK